MRIARAGWPFVLGCAAAGGAMMMLAGLRIVGIWPVWIAGLAFLAAGYCAYFFRDPARTIPSEERWILSPADGKILEVVQGQDNGRTVWLVRIFLSVFDPHLQRAPMTGVVTKVSYQKGKFLDARHPQAHFENEQNRLDIIGQAGSLMVPISVTQIAGLIARRIVCWTKEGASLAAGQQFGLIRFGSQVDITFPVSARVRIKVGDRVEAGQTVLAEIV
jgi:phosphatidylserine decarboxylase